MTTATAETNLFAALANLGKNTNSYAFGTRVR